MSKTQTVQIPEEIEKEITLLRGFRDLVAERVGYFFGAKMLSKKMSDETVKERKAVRETSKSLKEAISQLIETPTKENSEKVKDIQTQVKDAKDKNKTARAPHMKKITPLRKAVRYLDVVAIPDSLKELGKPVQPLFSLSAWVKKAITK